MDRPVFDRAGLQQKIIELEAAMSQPDFWNNRMQAERTARELADAKKTIETWATLARDRGDLAGFVDLTDENDTAAVTELTTAIEEFRTRLVAAELTLYLSGEFDDHDAILDIHAGAGGADAADWAEMLLRMYIRYAERSGRHAEIIEKSDAEIAGIKSATLVIRGDHAYGFLKGEKGAHRLVRRSPFNSAASRETSFAKVEVLPDIPDDGEIVIRPDEIEVGTFRSGGSGGQHVNKTESAIRITHLPTGIAVVCQTEKSQHQNRERAMATLRGKLAERKVEEFERRAKELRGEAAVADFGGDAIRSYILDDRRVKDRRTGYETTNPDKVLDGDLEPLIRAYLVREQSKK